VFGCDPEVPIGVRQGRNARRSGVHSVTAVCQLVRGLPIGRLLIAAVGTLAVTCTLRSSGQSALPGSQSAVAAQTSDYYSSHAPLYPLNRGRRGKRTALPPVQLVRLTGHDVGRERHHSMNAARGARRRHPDVDADDARVASRSCWSPSIRGCQRPPILTGIWCAHQHRLTRQVGRSQVSVGVESSQVGVGVRSGWASASGGLHA
jgi:hypothetical protein